MTRIIKGIFPGTTYNAVMNHINLASLLEANPKMRFSTRILIGTFDGVYRDERTSARSNPHLERVCPRNKCETLFEKLANTGVNIETYGIHLNRENPEMSWVEFQPLFFPPKCSDPEKINAYYIYVGDRESAGGATLISDNPALATDVHTALVKRYNKLGSPEDAINWLVNKSGFDVSVLEEYPNFFDASLYSPRQARAS
ncbi:MAG: hypothetical protein Q7S39_00535 [Ignavibacteria bacterium]|nr:hypothetical protein [Ignavibacteria bacterium]